ncbi:hypothetical protein Shyhy01_12030 [Streptomyces hygroscopicus subsp. hygroscopicus]|nr:hypothetical protein Shyhy01_12030 [Streptomyces hygroscopicus subsp. hygroscopicus]
MEADGPRGLPKARGKPRDRSAREPGTAGMGRRAWDGVRQAAGGRRQAAGGRRQYREPTPEG